MALAEELGSDEAGSSEAAFVLRVDAARSIG